MPDSLPGGDTAKPAVVAGVPAKSSEVVDGIPLEEMTDRAVARNVRPLRRQLDALDNRIRMRDVIGGFGYILGITGIALIILARRQRGRVDKD